MVKMCVRAAVVAAVLTAAQSVSTQEQAPPARREAISTISSRTTGMKKIDGFFPMYWDETGGRLFLEIPKLDTEVLHSTGFATGLGSNDIGIDRGALSGARIVKFERVGPRVLMRSTPRSRA
jgi:hypothetical protein